MVSHQENNARRIAALDGSAEALGLKKGMGIADARAMHPGIDIVEADSEADRRLLESLADWCDRYTPLVALDGVDALFLDISGCAHLFGGEERLLQDMPPHFLDRGFDARVGIASTAGAAWAAARFHAGAIVAAGAEAALLRSLPLAALRLEAGTRTLLEGVGLRSVGAVMDAPRAPLARRFGKLLLVRLDQALGRIEEAVSPRLPVPLLSVERPFAEPILLLEDIERVILPLAAGLKCDLERRAEGARVFDLALFRVDGVVARVQVKTSRPVREPHVVQRLFRERLGAVERHIDAGCGFDLVRLSVTSAAPLDAIQADLTGENAAAEGGLEDFVDCVRARLGYGAVLQSRMVESHLPERAVALLPFGGNDVAGIGGSETGEQRAARAERPSRLFADPEPVEVTAELPEGPPLHFRWRRALYRIARAEGPERLAPEWWREPSEATRDYFRVEDGEGRRYWLYRQGLYGASQTLPRWFLHGVFA